MSESGKQLLLLVAIVVCLVLIVQPNALAALTKRQDAPRRVLSQAEMQLFTTTANTGEIVMVGSNGVLIDQGSQSVRVGTDAVSIFAGASERLKVSNTGNIGINTNPAGANCILNVNGSGANTISIGSNAAGVGNYFTYLGIAGSDGDTLTGSKKGMFIIRNDAGGLLFGNSINPIMNLSNNTNVGIGTIDPQSKLHVEGNIMSAAGVGGYYDCLNGINSNVNYGSGSAIILQTGQERNWMVRMAQYTGDGDNNYFFLDMSNPGSSTISAAYSIRRTSNGSVFHNMSGSVGIGTNNPNSMLHVWGSCTIESGFMVKGTDFFLGSAGTGRGNGGRAMVQDSGNILILNYAQDFSSTKITGQLAVNASPNNYFALTVGAGNGAVDPIAVYPTIDGHLISFYNTNGSSLRGMIAANGADSVAYLTSSDSRLKQNVQPIQNATDIINHLRPVRFEWTSDGLNDYGFIAQEVYKVLPHMRPDFSHYMKNCSCSAVSISKGFLCDYCISMNDQPVDDDGKPKYYTLDYGKFTPYLVAAVQEQQSIISYQQQTISQQQQQLLQQQQTISSLSDRLSRIEALLSR